jgi:hypothetical protein
LQQVTQSAAAPPQGVDQKIQDRLPGGNLPWTTRPTQGFSGGPPEAPIGNVPLPRERPPEAPPPPQTISQTSPKPTQAYAPPAPKKMEHWGDDYWAIRAAEQNPDIFNTQYMPTEQESYGVLRGAPRQTAAFSAPAVAGLANTVSGLASIVGPFFDFFSKNAFSQNYRRQMLGGLQQEDHQMRIQEHQMRMREDEMKMKRERLIDTAEQLRITHSMMLSDYKSVYDDLNAAGNTPEAQEQAKEQIAELNQKWHHQNLDTLLQNGGLGAVSNALDVEHNKFLHSWAATVSLQSSDKTRKEQEKEAAKAEKQAEIEAPYRKQGVAPATGATESGGVIGYTPPKQPETAPVGATAAEPAAGPDLTQSPALDAADSAGFERGAINDLAEQMLNGDFKQAEFKGNDRVIGLARQREIEMRKQLNDIKHNPNLKTQDDVLNAVAGVSPELKDRVAGLLSGAITAPQRGSVGSAKAPWNHVYSMAEKAEPNIGTILQTRPGTLRSFASGPDSKQVAQLGTAYDHGKALLYKLENLPPWYLQLAASFHAMPFGRQIIGRLVPEASAQIAALEKDIQVFGSETGAVLAYGQGTGAERQALQEGIDWTVPPRAIATVKDQLERLRDREAHIGQKFKYGTGMDFNEYKQKFGIENPDAGIGLDQIDRDRAEDKNVQDYRTYMPGGSNANPQNAQ